MIISLTLCSPYCHVQNAFQLLTMSLHKQLHIIQARGIWIMTLWLVEPYKMMMAPRLSHYEKMQDVSDSSYNHNLYNRECNCAILCNIFPCSSFYLHIAIVVILYFSVTPSQQSDEELAFILSTLWMNPLFLVMFLTLASIYTVKKCFFTKFRRHPQAAFYCWSHWKSHR